MNIFFTASVRGKKEHLEIYKKIYRILSAKNKVISNHVFKHDVEEIHKWDPEYRFSFYQSLFDKIRTADFLVAEISTPSINICYEVCIALELKKIAVVLYTGTQNPELLRNIDQELAENRLYVIQYENVNLEKQLKEVLHEVKHNVTRRFTILLPARILNHLDEMAKKKQIPRSLYIRDLIEKDIKK